MEAKMDYGIKGKTALVTGAKKVNMARKLVQSI